MGKLVKFQPHGNGILVLVTYRGVGFSPAAAKMVRGLRKCSAQCPCHHCPHALTRMGFLPFPSLDGCSSEKGQHSSLHNIGPVPSSEYTFRKGLLIMK